MSINQDSSDSYHSLDDKKPSPQASQPTRQEGFSFAMTMAIALVIGVFCAIIAAGIALGANENVYNPNKPYVMPDRAVIQMTYRLPYFDASFSQPITATVDHVAGKARLEYYGGANIAYFDNKANSTQFTLAPEYNKQVCFKSVNEKATPLPPLFPKLTYREGDEDEEESDDHGPRFQLGAEAKHVPLYTKQPFQEKIDNILHDVWFYSFIQHANGTNYDTLIPDKHGAHVGNYTFYVNAKTGEPRRFYARQAHSAFISGSHLEDYVVDYISITPIESAIPDAMLTPPSGMPCVEDHIEMNKRQRLSSPVAMMTGSMSHKSPMKRQVMEDSMFELWSQKHQQVYATEQERLTRKATFFKNVDMIAAHNANPNKSYTMGLTKFAAMSAEELTMLGGRKPSQKAVADVCTDYVPLDVPIDNKKDWRSDERLTKYLNATINTHNFSQGFCGLCWGYGLTRAAATQHFLVNDDKYDPEKPVDISVQQVADCTNGPEYDIYGCGGGIDSWGASWILTKNGGYFAEDSSYGFFRSQNGYCHYSINDPAVDGLNPATGQKIVPFTRMTSCEHVGEQWNKEEEVKDLVKLVDDARNALFNHGPLSVSIAVPQSLYFYQSGVYDDAACGHLNSQLTHTVTLVGYDKDEETFTIANSWSQYWGEEGFARISSKGNLCGVATTPLVVNIEKK